MADNQHVNPIGRVVTRGDPICKYERELSGTVIPGMLVGMASNEYTVKKTDGTITPFAWAGFENTPVAFIPDTIDTAYKEGDTISALAGGNFEIFAHVSGEASTGSDVTIYPGTYLADNGDGTLKVFSPNGTVSSTTASNPMPPVAIAQEYKVIPKASGATPDVVRLHVLSLI